ncbi:ABC-2 transporter permease [Anaerosporobacter faecicola]|uniref:ABC-2 transporter permease n=1 Tax=Anaerosporobacter faecicola TaxID=2718714 RepID=UPI00143B0E11|nr:ABC-2 transporter permease [Anaerosporobacter faecicola]
MLRGLFIKDLIVLKKSFIIALALLIFYSILGIGSGDLSFFATYFVVFFSIINISTFSFDEQSKWMSYVLTTSITRTKLVQSKYLNSFFFILGGMLCSTILSVVQHLTNPETPFTIFSSYSIGALAGGLLFNFIVLPIIFKLGSENSRMIMLAVLGIPTVLVIILSKNNVFANIDSAFLTQFLKYLPYLGSVVLILSGILSYMISLNIMKKKDF